MSGPRPGKPGPSIEVLQIDLLHHVVRTPCGLSWMGIVTSEDVQIQVRRALDHVGGCGQCIGDTTPKSSEADRG